VGPSTTTSPKAVEPNNSNQPQFDQGDWMDLCFDLNDKLFPIKEPLKLRLSTIIETWKWESFNHSTVFIDLLNSIKNSKGNPGLVVFRDTLEKLGHKVGVDMIDRSRCAYMFKK